MSRRVTLPGADELFRATSSGLPASAAAAVQLPEREAAAPLPVHRMGDGGTPTAAAMPSGREEVRPTGASSPPRAVRQTSPRRSRQAQRQPTGRERHEEKITVYVSADELLDLEQARLVLRGEHGLAVDRGRIVREALAVVLADLEAKGQSSILVRRLLES